MSQWNIKCFVAWFQQQDEFHTAIEEITSGQLKKCPQKFYLFARKRDGTFYKKKSLFAIRGQSGARGRPHWISPFPISKTWIIGDAPFTEAITCKLSAKEVAKLRRLINKRWQQEWKLSVEKLYVAKESPLSLTRPVPRNCNKHQWS